MTNTHDATGGPWDLERRQSLYDLYSYKRKADAKRKQRELEADGLMWDCFNNPAADRLKF